MHMARFCCEILPDDTEVTEAQAADHLEMPSDAFTGAVFSGDRSQVRSNRSQLAEYGKEPRS